MHKQTVTQLAQAARAMQAEIDAAGMGDPLKRENAELRAENETLRRLHEERTKLTQAAVDENERLRARIAELETEREELLAETDFR